MKHVLKTWALTLGVAATTLPLCAPRAGAAAHTYNTKVQTIRVGVLLANAGAWADGNVMTTNPHRFSYVFQALNARPDIRPYSWEVVNPHAAPFMDDTAARRYGVTFNPSNPPRLGKNMGAYWEVFLKDASTETLSDYDVLYMPFPLNDENGNALTVQDREKLRRAVDGGTILWLDNVNGGAGSPQVGGKLIVDPTFLGLPPNAIQNGDPMQSLLNTPNPLSQREIRSIGLPGMRSRIRSAAVDGSGGENGWQQVLFAGGSATAAVFPCGQGAIVLTGGAIGVQLTQGIRQGDTPNQVTAGNPSRLGYLANNTGAVSGSDARFISSAALKFMVNLVSFGFQNQQEGGGPRHASGSRQDLNTPLGRKWQYPDNFRINQSGFPGNTPFVSNPAVWNGIAYAATTDGFLRAYDMDPYSDLDGDGNPDDGLPNGANSASDIIWQAQLPAPASSLTVGTVGNETFVYGMLADGRVFRARGLTWGMVNGKRRILPTSAIQTSAVFGAYGPLLAARPSATIPGENAVFRIPAPVWYNGRLFAVGVQKSPSADTGFGSVAEIDPQTLRVLWQFPETTRGSGQISQQSRLGIPSATPTVAAIPDKGYADATDIMLLVPTLSIRPEDNMGLVQSSRVVAFPLGVRGERLLHVANDNNLGDIYYTRLAGVNAPAVEPNSVRLWVQGNPRSYPGAPNIDPQRFRRLYFSGVGLPAGAGDEVRADYDFAPGPPTGNFAGYGARWAYDAWKYQTSAGQLFTEILTSPVVSSDGAIYWVASDLGQGGGQPPTIYGVQMNEGRQTTDPQRDPTRLQTLNRPILTFLYRIGQNAGANFDGAPPPVALGTPAVDRGVLYVPWGQWSGTGQSRGGVTGFHVKGTQFGLLLSQPIDEQQKGKTAVFQRNLATGLIEPVSFGLLDQRNVSIGNQLRGLLLFTSLSSGSGQSTLDPSRPGDILVSYWAADLSGGQSVQIPQESPTTYYKVGSREGTDASILMAYDAAVPQGRGGIRTGVTVAGGSMYVGTDNGEVWTVPLPTDLEVLQQQDSNKPQTTYMRPATFPSLAVSAGFPQNGYPADPAMALRAAPVVANNTLLVNSPVGFYTFYSPRTLITDNNRILEVATAYKPAMTQQNQPDWTNISLAGSAAVWSLDSTTQTRDFGRPGAGPDTPPWGGTVLSRPVERPLNQPTMAVRVNTTNTLISDTGNNRVVEVDRAGRVVWQLTDFADPYGLLAPNESRTLSSPTSVQRWETYEYDPEDRVGARVQHTLIADFGNNRVVEVVSRYSADPNQWANNVLVWVGKGPQGSNYHFYQAQREPYVNETNANDPNNGNMDYGRTIASVTNVAVNSADADIGAPFNGSITNDPATPGGSIVILAGREDKDVKGQNASGKVVYFFNRMIYGTDTSTVFPLARPTYFQRYTTGAGALNWVLMMTDGQNVFDLTPSGTPGIGKVVVNEPKYPDLFPIVGNAGLGQAANGGVGSGGYTLGTAMAKRLQNGDILMVNQQTGYVFEFSPTAAKSGAPASQVLQVTAPPIEGTSTLVRPVYADRIF